MKWKDTYSDDWHILIIYSVKDDLHIILKNGCWLHVVTGIATQLEYDSGYVFVM